MMEVRRHGQSDARVPDGARIVAAPRPYVGVGQALRASFASPRRLPDDWVRLLDRLG